MTRAPVRLVAALALAACNSAPSSVVVKIVPVEAETIEARVRSNDDLTVEFLAEARDLNQDELTYEFAWSVDGTERSEFTTETVPAEATAKGQTWSVTVTPTDGKRKGEPYTTEVLIQNTPPVAEASTPFAEVISTDPLTMSGSGTDIDGDDVEMRYYWTNDGEGTPFDGPSVPPAFTYPGETWVGHAVAFDGEEASAPATIEILVLNGLPVIDSLELSTDEVYTDTELTAIVEASDPDDQPVELTYTWKVDGTVVLQGVDRNVLDASRFSKHQEIELTVVPDDGVDEGEAATTTVTVRNTPPTQPVVSIFPEEPIPGIDDMRCVIDTPSTDTDGDPIEYRVTWTVDGAAFTAATTTTVPGDTVARRFFFDDEEWRCEMTPYDDDEDGVTAAIEVVPETWAGPRVFTTCNKTGNKGPSQADCDGSDGYLETTLEDEVIVMDGIQEWTVPVDGTYRITARGSEGGRIAASGRSAGRGAIIRGDFFLERGDVLQIAVGQPGREGSNSAGGGGATWVMRSDDTPLIIAGGGGSTGYYGAYSNRRNGCDASSSQYGRRGGSTSSSVPSYACSLKTYDLRRGGRSAGTYSAHAGGGIDSDGANDPYASWLGGSGGKSWANGVEGGGGAAQGGFGGGGSGTGSLAAGGGGGYSGGDSSRTISGGGGSYNSGSNQSNSVGHAGPGTVTIDWLGL